MRCPPIEIMTSPGPASCSLQSHRFSLSCAVRGAACVTDKSLCNVIRGERTGYPPPTLLRHCCHLFLPPWPAGRLITSFSRRLALLDASPPPPSRGPWLHPRWQCTLGGCLVRLVVAPALACINKQGNQRIFMFLF